MRQNRAVGDAHGSATGVAPAHENEAPSTGPTMEQIFGPGGFLERSMIGGYEHRPAQLQMRRRCTTRLQSPSHGCGSGNRRVKHWRICCRDLQRRRVVISTPPIASGAALSEGCAVSAKHFAPNLKVAVMKAAPTFCPLQMHALADQPMLKGMEEWTRSGRSATVEADGNRRSCRATFCRTIPNCGRALTRAAYLHREKMPEFEKCFLTQMQSRAKEADLIIVNLTCFSLTWR